MVRDERIERIGSEAEPVWHGAEAGALTGEHRGQYRVIAMAGGLG
jgi:hypothetical protein